jgi:hypothetical protein
MNRRAFVSALVATPLISRLPNDASLMPSAERRFRLARGGFIDVEVMLALTERQARELRLREAQDPFNGLAGEFYVSGSSPVDIPDHLPGTLTTFETVVGVAAEQGSVHVGGFRRGCFVWSIRANAPVEHAVETAEAIAAVDLPDELDVRLAPSLLKGLLPVVDDFSVEVRIRQ